MKQFHALEVIDVKPTTADAIIVSLRPAPEDQQLFGFRQGQYLTLRQSFDGEEIRRCYSICAARGEPFLQVGIKKVEGGLFSTWAQENLSPGTQIEAMPPQGRFYSEVDEAEGRHYLTIAVGSGITPIISNISTLLAAEPQARVTLIYGNRSVNTIMFREELEDLKNRYLGRFNLIHILKNDAQDIDMFSGRIDRAKVDALFSRWIDISSVDLAFLCGPEAMMQMLAEALKSHGLEEGQIKYEIFAANAPTGKPRPETTGKAVQASVKARITLDGASRDIDASEGLSVLDIALKANLDAPFACKSGICSTCRAKLTEGEIEMLTNHALDDDEINRGFILTCQAYPRSTKIAVDYDH